LPKIGIPNPAYWFKKNHNVKQAHRHTAKKQLKKIQHEHLNMRWKSLVRAHMHGEDGSTSESGQNDSDTEFLWMTDIVVHRHKVQIRIFLIVLILVLLIMQSGGCAGLDLVLLLLMIVFMVKYYFFKEFPNGGLEDIFTQPIVAILITSINVLWLIQKKIK